MKTTITFVIAVMMLGNVVFAQKYVTKTGKVSFFSTSPMENIEAHNKQVNAALDASTGDFVFKILIKSFEFEKALMQEHFNENYMESDKFPNSTFQGKITNLGSVDFTKNGEYDAEVSGKLTIHGITKDVTEKGKFVVKDGNVQGLAKFSVRLADYDIKIPKAVVNNIAEVIEITVDVNMNPLK